MTSIRTVNMLWEKRIRGAYPVSRYALDDSGTVTLAVPRPLEARAYDLTRLRLDGSSEVRTGFGVETLLKLEVSAQADDFLGMTADDVYLFRLSGKIRLLGDRRVCYSDAALSADGKRIVAGFSDMAGASFALAYGEIGGRITWTRDVEAVITQVAISRDGVRITLGAENGTMWLWDNGRREFWVFEQPEPVRALACSGNGLRVAYGTQAGAVGLIDGEGTRLWEARLPGEIAGLALSSDGTLCAALCYPPETPGSARIFCLDDNGQVGWEYDAEKRLLGLSLSGNGHYLATGSRDGTTTVYEVITAEGAVGADSAALNLWDLQPLVTSDPVASREAYLRLRTALKARPTDLSLLEAVTRQKVAWYDAQFATVQTNRNAADYQAALEALEAILQVEPRQPQAVALWEGLSNDRARQLLDIGRNLRQAEDEAGAEAALMQAIQVAPDLPDPRRELAQMVAQRARQTDLEADRLLAQGSLEAGLAALERAQAKSPTPERAMKMAFAQTAMEFSIGMTAYNEKRYKEAIFQFKKVLARDSGHSDARRYLAYAQNFDQNASTESLNDRFRLLE